LKRLRQGRYTFCNNSDITQRFPALLASYRSGVAHFQSLEIVSLSVLKYLLGPGFLQKARNPDLEWIFCVTSPLFFVQRMLISFCEQMFLLSSLNIVCV
jgi:hypothetical protein